MLEHIKEVLIILNKCILVVAFIMMIVIFILLILGSNVVFGCILTLIVTAGGMNIIAILTVFLIHIGYFK